MTFSIVTICYNNLHEVIPTLESVDNQICKDYEHIIIDGSSNLEIKSYLESSSNNELRVWVCESDRGIADAFNKGIRKSKGQFILLLNAGDLLYDENTLATVKKAVNESLNPIDWLHGDFITKRSGHTIQIGKPFEKEKLYRGMRRVCHQTMYIHKRLHEKYGKYDIQEKIGMDYDFLCRISNEPFLYLNQPLAIYQPGGVSEQSYFRALNDQKRIFLKYYPYTIKIDLWILRQYFLYTLQHSFFGKFLFSLKKILRLENW